MLLKIKMIYWNLCSIMETFYCTKVFYYFIYFIVEKGCLDY